MPTALAAAGMTFVLGVACTSDGDVSAPDVPTPSALPRPSTPAPATDLPAGWTTCTNEVHGFEVGYPADWHTEATSPESACTWFDPEPFEVEPQTEAPLTALVVRTLDRPYGRVIENLGERHRVLSREETEVAGHDALRYERVQTEGVLFPRGTRSYGYFVEHDEGVLHVHTLDPPGGRDRHGRNKDVVDEAATTLVFRDAR